MACKKKEFPRTKFCAGGLRHIVQIETRSSVAASVDGYSPVITFTTLKQTWAGIETTNGTRRFNGVNIDDRATHLFYVRSDPAIRDLETGNNFVKHDARRFRILAITRADEDPYMLVIQATERGDDDQRAADA